MSGNKQDKAKSDAALMRKKAALRDNLKRRKTQVREMKSPDDKQLRLRERDIKPT